jgi:hypothetical protein
MVFDGSSVPRSFSVNTYLGVLCAINLPLAVAGNATPAMSVATTTYSQIAGQRREPAAGTTAAFMEFISPPGANFAENLSDKDGCHRRAESQDVTLNRVATGYSCYRSAAMTYYFWAYDL